VVGAKVDPLLAERLHAAGVRPGYTVARLNGDTSHLRNSDRELRNRIPVSLVPREVLEPGSMTWEPIAWGRWWLEDHITLGEGRAALALLERLAASPAAHGHEIDCLEDNEPWSAASAKGRSPSVALNFLLRKRTALSCAARIMLSHPWVDTKHQPADELSRLK